VIVLDANILVRAVPCSAPVLDCGQHYFSSRIDGVKVIPTNNPSGPIAKSDCWPEKKARSKKPRKPVRL
jgi:hypothetical protein